MAHFERVRDVISGPFSTEVLKQRTAAGWQLVSLVWRRELPESEALTQGAFNEEIPYGLRISDDCQRLEIDPVENRTLMLMMELLIQDFPYSSIVSDLNEKGLRMRDGRPWTRVAVFNMTPRLIEVGPRLFSTEEWNRARQKFSRQAPSEIHSSRVQGNKPGITIRSTFGYSLSEGPSVPLLVNPTKGELTLGQRFGIGN